MFSCQLGAMECFPTAACVGLPSPACTPHSKECLAWGDAAGDGAVLEVSGLWGPPVESCPPPLHPCCSSPLYRGELEVKGWEKEDVGHRSQQGRGHGGYGR